MSDDLILHSATYQRLELELFNADGVTPLDTTGWTIHLRISQRPELSPALALSSAVPAEIQSITPLTGRWDAHIPQTAALVPGRYSLMLFGVDTTAKRHLLGEELLVMVRTGWVA